MHFFHSDNLPPEKSYMRNTELSKLTFAILPDLTLYQVIPVGEDEVVLVSTVLRPQMEMGGVMSMRELTNDFKNGYLGLSFDSMGLDEDDLSFMGKMTYLDRIRDRA